MFRRHRDLPPLLLILLLFLLAVLTLSQILVIQHVGRYSANQRAPGGTMLVGGTGGLSAGAAAVIPGEAFSHNMAMMGMMSPVAVPPPPAPAGGSGGGPLPAAGGPRKAVPDLPPRSPNDVYRVASLAAASVKNKDISSVLAKLKYKFPSVEVSRRLWRQEKDSHRVSAILRSAAGRRNSTGRDSFPRAGPPASRSANRNVPAAAVDQSASGPSTQPSPLGTGPPAPPMDAASNGNASTGAGVNGSGLMDFAWNLTGAAANDVRQRRRSNVPASPGREAGMEDADLLRRTLYNDITDTEWRTDADKENGGPLATSLATPATTTTEAPASKLRNMYCPLVPPHLRGRMKLELPVHESMSEVAAENAEVQMGGRWRPAHCVARHRVAIIIPYRDRLQHLTTLLHYLHPILQRQQLDYTVFVVEQLGNLTFNKARLMNVAFLEAVRAYPFSCAVFHDVDLIPEDDRNMYSCPVMPRHMSVAIDEMNYRLQYPELVGGVLAMQVPHFQLVNGYSNMYWGWGAEDDDMAYRIQHAGLKITRPPIAIARYSMIRHTKRKPSDWKKRYKLLYTGLRRQKLDGLNSVRYRFVSRTAHPLYTHLLIDIGKPPPGF